MGGSESTQAPREFPKEWRDMPWGKNYQLEDSLRTFELSNKSSEYVRILVVGEVGAGKSSFINSVNNVFQHRITSGALVDTTAGTSFTKVYKTHQIEGKNGKPLPFVFNDIMGLEAAEGYGANPQEIIQALKGFIEEGHRFNSASSVKNQQFSENSVPQNRIFCLVNIVAADKLSLMNQKVIDKLRSIREAASELEIPQAIILTKIDDACPLVKADITKVYKSCKIKEKMQECSNYIGVPLSHIFPVKNYHEEIDTKQDIDLLILKALEQIVNIANDNMKSKFPNQTE